MKVLVCGDRNWIDVNKISNRLALLPEGSIIVEGEAKGADIIARNSAVALGFEVKRYPADWSKYGRAAGPIRNREQFDKEQPELVIAFHSDIENSKGTLDMVNYARSKDCLVEIIE